MPSFHVKALRSLFIPLLMMLSSSWFGCREANTEGATTQLEADGFTFTAWYPADRLPLSIAIACSEPGYLPLLRQTPADSNKILDLLQWQSGRLSPLWRCDIPANETVRLVWPSGDELATRFASTSDAAMQQLQWTQWHGPAGKSVADPEGDCLLPVGWQGYAWVASRGEAVVLLRRAQAKPWQGYLLRLDADKPGQEQPLGPGLAYGSASLATGGSVAVVTPAGRLEVYDFPANTMRDLPEWSAAATQLKADGAQSNLGELCLNEGCLAYRAGAVWKLWQRSGQRHQIVLIDPLSTAPDGRFRPSAAVLANGLAEQRGNWNAALANECKRLPLDVAGGFNMMVPLDTQTMALVDLWCDRITLISTEAAAAPYNQ